MLCSQLEGRGGYVCLQFTTRQSLLFYCMVCIMYQPHNKNKEIIIKCLNFILDLSYLLIDCMIISNILFLGKITDTPL
jgi:hypothetical protein